MGQKMHPHGLRVGVIKDWNSKWYADSKNFSDYLVEDHKIREYVKKKLFVSGISKIEIERTAKFVRVNVYTAKPGILIGKGGAGAEALRLDIKKLIGKDVNLTTTVKTIGKVISFAATKVLPQLVPFDNIKAALKGVSIASVIVLSAPSAVISKSSPNAASNKDFIFSRLSCKFCLVICKSMRIYDIIAKKRDKKELTKLEIEFFVNGFTNGEIADYYRYLAICQYPKDDRYYLFCCDENYEVVSDMLYNSVEECMAIASQYKENIVWNKA